jgi:hypothetical protein
MQQKRATADQQVTEFGMRVKHLQRTRLSRRGMGILLKNLNRGASDVGV